MKTILLTTAQALVKFLNQQYVEFNGTVQRLVKDVFTIFGHGNVLGIGQALAEDAGELKVYQERNEQWWHVRVAGVSKSESIQQAYLRKEETRKQARQY